MMDKRETPLLTREDVEAMYKKLQQKPDKPHICPRCKTLFSAAYEACYCRRYGVYDEKDWKDVLPIKSK
jgi:hypothetical protein